MIEPPQQGGDRPRRQVRFGAQGAGRLPRRRRTNDRPTGGPKASAIASKAVVLPTPANPISSSNARATRTPPPPRPPARPSTGGPMRLLDLDSGGHLLGGRPRPGRDSHPPIHRPDDGRLPGQGRSGRIPALGGPFYRQQWDHLGATQHPSHTRSNSSGRRPNTAGPAATTTSRRVNTFRCDNTDPGPTSSATTASRSPLDSRPGNRSPLCPGASRPSVTDLGDKPRSARLGVPTGQQLAAPNWYAASPPWSPGPPHSGPTPDKPGVGLGGVDLRRSLREQLLHPIGDPSQAPPRQPTRPISFRLDGVTPRDRFGRSGHPAVDRRPGGKWSADQCRVQTLGPALGVAHLHHIGHQHMIMNIRIPRPARPMPGLGPHQTPGRRAPLSHPPAAPTRSTTPSKYAIVAAVSVSTMACMSSARPTTPRIGKPICRSAPPTRSPVSWWPPGAAVSPDPSHPPDRTPTRRTRRRRCLPSPGGPLPGHPTPRASPHGCRNTPTPPWVVITPGQHRLRVIRHRFGPHRPHPRHRTNQPRRQSPQGGDTLQSRFLLSRSFYHRLWFSSYCFYHRSRNGITGR